MKSPTLKHHPSAIKIQNRLIIYCFTSRSRIFHLYGDITIAREELQHLGLCLALRVFEQGGIFIVPHLLWHGTSVFLVSSEWLPHLVASYHKQRDVDDLYPGSSQNRNNKRVLMAQLYRDLNVLMVLSVYFCLFWSSVSLVAIMKG
jgi:hypothetical protein